MTVANAATTDAGLRERKKAATRRSLGIAAMRLAIARGPDNVHPDDIAAEVGVSTRTFNNYFASKYEAICSVAMERGHAIGAALRSLPPAEPLIDAVTVAVLQPYQHADQAPDRDWIEGVRLVIRSPALQGEFLRTQYAAQRELADAIADRIGTSPSSMYPAVVAGAVTAAMHVALDRWLSADPPRPLAPLIRQAMSQLRCDCALPANSLAIDVHYAHADTAAADPVAPKASDLC